MDSERPCTCHPMERPHPCARRFALSECKSATILDPICYRRRHQKDEVWKYGHQPKHLVPPRGKELIGYYIVEPLYTQSALDAVRADALEEAAKVCTQTDSDGCGPDEWGWVASDFARNIRALTRQAQSDALAAARNDVLEKALDEAYYTGATEDVMDAIRALKENSDE